MEKTTKIGKAALTALVLFAFAVYYAMIMVFLPKPFGYGNDAWQCVFLLGLC